MAEGRSDGAVLKVAVIGLVSAVLVALIYNSSSKAFRSNRPQVELTVIVSSDVTSEPIQGAVVISTARVNQVCSAISEKATLEQVLTDAGGLAHFYLPSNTGPICVSVQASGFYEKDFSINAPLRDNTFQVTLERTENRASAGIPSKANNKLENGNSPPRRKQQSTGTDAKESASGTANARPTLRIFASPPSDPAAAQVLSHIVDQCLSRAPFGSERVPDRADAVLIVAHHGRSFDLYLVGREAYLAGKNDSLSAAVWSYTVSSVRETEFACTGQLGLRSHADLLRARLENDMPGFPWRVPPWSARIDIPKEKFGAAATLGTLSKTLDAALNKTGYFERSYFRVPNGIAIATRMEQIDDYGRPVREPDRWSGTPTSQPGASLLTYIRALFAPTGSGRYRVIAFIVTDLPIIPSTEVTAPTVVSKWAGNGASKLPPTVARRTLSPDYDFSVTALVYEFLKEEDREARELTPESNPHSLAATTHLNESGLWAALRLPKLP